MGDSNEEEKKEIHENLENLSQIINNPNKPPSKQEIVKFLQELRLDFLAQVEKGKNPEKVSRTMGFKIYQGGMIALQTSLLSAKGAAASLGAGVGGVTPGPFKFLVGGLIYTAKTGIDYRKYKKG